MMRVVSLLPSATEIVFAIGAEASLVGVTHECDFPPAAAGNVALVVRERFKREDGELEIRRANVYRIRGDEIAEVWIFEGDQYAVDELFAED